MDITDLCDDILELIGEEVKKHPRYKMREVSGAIRPISFNERFQGFKSLEPTISIEWGQAGGQRSAGTRDLGWVTQIHWAVKAYRDESAVIYRSLGGWPELRADYNKFEN